MNKSTYVILPSAIKNDKEEDGEEEMDPLMIHRLKCIEEKYARKNRWIAKVEKEDRRTFENAKIASNRAGSCLEAMGKTINKNPAA